MVCKEPLASHTQSPTKNNMNPSHAHDGTVTLTRRSPGSKCSPEKEIKDTRVGEIMASFRSSGNSNSNSNSSKSNSSVGAGYKTLTLKPRSMDLPPPMSPIAVTHGRTIGAAGNRMCFSSLLMCMCFC
jgi:hypothetical protein